MQMSNPLLDRSHANEHASACELRTGDAHRLPELRKQLDGLIEVLIRSLIVAELDRRMTNIVVETGERRAVAELARLCELLEICGSRFAKVPHAMQERALSNRGKDLPPGIAVVFENRLALREQRNRFVISLRFLQGRRACKEHDRAVMRERSVRREDLFGAVEGGEGIAVAREVAEREAAVLPRLG